MDKIERFIRGDSYSAVMDRFLGGSSNMTSSVASSVSSYNKQPSYQRTISNDSSTKTSSDEAGAQGGSSERE